MQGTCRQIIAALCCALANASIDGPHDNRTARQQSELSLNLTQCQVVVVGGGWAGIYAAWRLSIDTQSVSAKHMCIFEARGAIGGRTYSVNVSVRNGMPLVVDVGAYRFSKSQHLPSDLIDHLNLKVQCYKPSCSPEEGKHLYRLVDANGDSTGYATAMRMMLMQLQKSGAQLFLHHALSAVFPHGAHGAMVLRFSNGVHVVANSAILNIPRPSMKKLAGSSLIFDSQTSQLLLRNCSTAPITGFKVYVIYEDPWWITKLKALEGYFKSFEAQPPFVGRYHDGAIQRLHGKQIGAGALEVLYTYSSDSSCDWYLQYRTNWSDPLTVSKNADLLTKIHKRLMDFHVVNFTARGLNTSLVAPPVQVVMGFWDRQGSSASFLSNPEPANMHGQFSPYPKETCLRSITADQYIASVSAPSSKYNIFIANDDWFWDTYSGSGCCWAENSLKPMEKILHDHFSLDKPPWLNTSYYQTDVLGYGMSPVSQVIV